MKKDHPYEFWWIDEFTEGEKIRSISPKVLKPDVRKKLELLFYEIGELQSTIAEWFYPEDGKVTLVTAIEAIDKELDKLRKKDYPALRYRKWGLLLHDKLDDGQSPWWEDKKTTAKMQKSLKGFEEGLIKQKKQFQKCLKYWRKKNPAYTRIRIDPLIISMKSKVNRLLDADILNTKFA